MVSNFNEWYQKSYPELTGFGIWLRGGEFNTLPFQENKNKYRILITRLSTYRDTAESFTHKLLYQIAVNNGFYADMAFLPPPRDIPLFQEDGIPWMLGSSSKLSPVEFDLIALSNSIVQELVNIAPMLQNSGISLSKKERMLNADLPLIILGGASALYTSVLLGEYPVVDGVFAGEDPGCIGELFSICREYRGKISKEQILLKLESVPGFFQPDKKVKTRKYVSAQLPEELFLSNAPVIYEQDTAGKGNLQISEGCSCFCSFCAESWGRKPYREFTSDTLVRAARTMKASMGLEKIDIYSFNFNMHLEFYSVLRELCGLFNSVSLKSQRFDFIADDPELIRFLHAAGKASITCGLEGISGRLRRYLQKGLDDSKIHSALNLLLRSPVRELKIFLIATGLENEEDFSDYKDLLTFISEAIYSAGRKPRIIFSMTPLVRFPFTPLQMEIAQSPRVIKEIILQTERITRSRGYEFRIAADLNDYFMSQILSRALNPSIMKALIAASEETGFVYHELFTGEFVEAFRRKLEDEGLGADELLSGVNWKESDSVPVEININQEFLHSCVEKVSQFEDGGYCAGKSEISGRCMGCGACEESETTNRIISARDKADYPAEKLRLMLNERRRNMVEYEVYFSIDESKRGIPRAVIASSLASALMKADEKLVESYCGFSGSFIERTLDSLWVYGDDILTLRWSGTGVEMLDDLLKSKKFIDRVNQFLCGWGMLVGKAFNTGKIFLKIDSPFQFDIQPYLSGNALKCTTSKKPSGDYNYEFTQQTLKKKLLLSLEVELKDCGCIAEFTCGPKFNLDNFIKTVFQLPSLKDWVRLLIETRIILSGQ